VTDRFDVVVIGGGIHGAGIAQAIAAAGYSVRVLEQYAQLAKGTSSRSSKLIHGGLRYLESRQFGLVRECLKERKTLIRNAPRLVQLKPFYIPVYISTLRRPWQLRLGLSLYAVLGGLSPETRFRTVNRKEWPLLDGLRQEGLETIFQFYDAQTDDVALTTSVMRSASTFGADLALNARLQHIELERHACTISYQQNHTQCTCRSSVVVNASGPWVNQIIKCVSPPQSQIPLELVQGTHILVRGPLKKGIYYVESPSDRRAVFIMPWKGNTLIGTTERRYEGDPSRIAPTQAEIKYLLDTVNYYFPQRNHNSHNIITAFAGARVLPPSDGNASQIKRETRLIPDRVPHPRLISIAGGKLTAYRATAEQVLREISTSLPKRKRNLTTRVIPLSSNTT
jgi:glycerol-3-phosphate dehydrogenase